MSELKPTVGRIVLVRSKEWGADEFPAIVNRVWSDTCINAMAFPDGPAPVFMSSVVMTEDFDSSGQWTGWRWMDYQKEQAARHGG